MAHHGAERHSDSRGPSDAGENRDAAAAAPPEELSAEVMDYLRRLIALGEDGGEDGGGGEDAPIPGSGAGGAAEAGLGPDERYVYCARDMAPFVPKLREIAEGTRPFTKESLLKCLPRGRHSDVGHFFELPRALLSLRKDDFEITSDCSATYKLVTPTPPCAAHDESHVHQVGGGETKRCSGCKLLYYHPGCYKAAWKAHKPFCEWLRARPAAAEFLRSTFRLTGLWTPDGETWRAVPFQPSARDAQWVQHWTQCWEMGFKKPPPFSLKYMYKCFAPPVEQFTTTLRQEMAGFHGCRDGPYYLLPLGRARPLVDELETHGITHFLDPMAAGGWFAAVLHHFGGVPAENIQASDLQPRSSQHFPVEAADALDPETYRGPAAEGGEKWAVVVSWPDFPNAPPVSPGLFRVLAGVRARWLLVMAEEVGCAMHPAGHAELEKWYEQVPLAGQPDFLIERPSLGQMMTITCEADARKVVPYSYYTRGWMSSVGQRIALYRLRPVAETPPPPPQASE